jgi:hypothetical protein
VNKSKERAADEFNREKSIIEYADINENNNAQDNTKPAIKGTMAVHFIKFITVVHLNVMNFIEN